MWLFTRQSFLSIVRHDTKPDHLLVRARHADDITQLWPTAAVTPTPTADYEFRAAIPEEEVIRAVTAAIRSIKYTTDFKGGVRDKSRHDAYMRVWQAMRTLGTTR